LAVDGRRLQSVPSVLHKKLGSPVLGMDGLEAGSPVPSEAQDGRTGLWRTLVSFVSSSQPAFLWGLQLEEALAQKYPENHPYVQPEAETELLRAKRSEVRGDAVVQGVKSCDLCIPWADHLVIALSCHELSESLELLTGMKHQGRAGSPPKRSGVLNRACAEGVIVRWLVVR
jgi:hypothetical protein